MIVVTPTTVDVLKVVTPELAAKWANNVANASDVRVPIYIQAAVEHAEAALNRAVFTQTRRTVTRMLPLHRLQLEPFTSITATRVTDDGAETDVLSDFIQEPETGLLVTKSDSFETINHYGYGYEFYGNRYRFDYECGWPADGLPYSILEMILGYVSHIARFHGQLSTNDQYLKIVPPLCRPYSIPIGQRPNWILV